MNQMAADLVVKEMAAEFVSAPFDTIGALIDSVSYGEVSLAIGPVGVFARAVKDGRLRILAVASRTRSPIAPDAPTLPELGFQSLVLEDYWGVSGPAKLPANVVATLTAGISDTVANSNVVAALHRLGVTPNFLDGESFASYVLEHRSIWSRAARPTPAR